MLKKNIINNNIKKGLKNFIFNILVYKFKINLKINLKMKNLLLIFLLTFSLGANAQYFSVTYINVSQEDVPEVARLETQYWSKVAKANIEAGNQLGWGLFAKVGGGSDSWTHAFINVFESIDQMMDQSIWNPQEIIGVSAEDISTSQYYNASAIHHYKIQGQVPGTDGTGAIWNFGRPENLQGFVQDNVKLWGPFFEKNDTGRTNWGIATKITGVNQSNATVMTWDGYDSVADAVKVLAGEGDNSGPSKSKAGEYMSNGFLARVVVQQVIWIQ
jgi:hypothetical protein